MKPLLLPILLTLFACQKSNLPIIQRWRVLEGSDHYAMNHAYFCDSSDYGGIDTITIQLWSGIDPNMFSLKVGSINVKPGSVDGDRHYGKLLENVTN